MFETVAPRTGDELRRAVYAGRVFRLARMPASQDLISLVWSILEKEVGPRPRQAQFRLSPDRIVKQLQRVRRRLLADGMLEHARKIVGTAGLDPRELATDALRLRAVTHLGHRIAAAAPAYTAHRDTWYANPRAQMNWWIPLHDVGEEETFWFYPDAFGQRVENTSGRFDYAEWKRIAGWQNPGRDARAEYPTVLEEPAGKVGFAARAGEVLLFSAAHLHQTRPNLSGATRFSVDFRTVHRGDHALGLGAPDVDNRSAGCTLEDYA